MGFRTIVTIRFDINVSLGVIECHILQIKIYINFSDDW